MTAKFEMSISDYNLSAEIKLGVQDELIFPNHADTREALNKLLFALANWDTVDITIKTTKESEDD